MTVFFNVSRAYEITELCNKKTISKGVVGYYSLCYVLATKDCSTHIFYHMLQLLGEVLLDRGNVNVMLRYINDPQNLRLVMLLLRVCFWEWFDMEFIIYHVN